MGVMLLTEPSDAHIGRFLDGQRSLPFSYPEVGASRDGAPPGYPVNHQGWLGTRQETFAHAVEALRGWKIYETGCTKLCWPEAPITEGTVVGVLGHHFGLWSLNACRVAYVFEEEGSLLKRYGIAFGTLPGHVERSGVRNGSLSSGTVQTTRCPTRCSPSPVQPARWLKRLLRACA
jgi:uncharacterized protein (UPF0548 family)